MLKNCDWPYSRSYRTGSENEPLEFYLTAFSNANSLDLLLGYFSFSAINVLSVCFAKFLANGGKMRVVANNILSKTDKDTILKARELGQIDGLIDLEDIRSVRYMLDFYSSHFFECMAWLIKNKRIEFVLIKPKGKLGISHYKAGVFSDGENKVMFSGSCNFTAYGMVENLERLDAYLSWENSRSSKKISDLKQDFEKLFKQEDDTVEYIPIDKVEEAIKDEFGNKDLQQLLASEQELIRIRQGLSKNKRLVKLLRSTEEQLKDIASKPKFPYSKEPREYQINAYNSWVANNYKGMFAMATGTGKTITSLNCLLNEYKKTGIYRAIITVPTTALVEQWKKECAKFNFKNIITVSSNENWDNNLAFFNTAARLIDTSYIVIVTYASLPRQRFQSYFTQLPKDTILIADETHNLGSQGLLRLLPNIHLEKRIGLSATPNRKFDEVGNNAIQDFFNDKPPYIFSYSMKEALEIGWLCQYTYYPHVVKLTDQEMDKYKELSLQLLRMGFFDKKTGKFRSTPEIEKKLLERKRIIHKAFNKLEAFKAILRSEFDKRKNLKYTLVYVPEGIEASFDDTDLCVETEDENSLINEYTKAVSQTDDSVRVK